MKKKSQRSYFQLPANSLILPGGKINVFSADVNPASHGAVPLTFFFKITLPSMLLNFAMKYISCLPLPRPQRMCSE